MKTNTIANTTGKTKKRTVTIYVIARTLCDGKKYWWTIAAGDHPGYPSSYSILKDRTFQDYAAYEQNERPSPSKRMYNFKTRRELFSAIAETGREMGVRFVIKKEDVY
jgi:hypothetical protein